MPIVTYVPNWEAMKKFFAKFEPHVPGDYTGLVGIRLHRTGFPLTMELFGPELPERPLYPMVLVEMKNGELAKSWDWIADQYDVPWARPEDFHRYRVDVMSNYHAEDLLEPRAEEILNSEHPDAETIKKALIDGAGVPA